MWSVHEVSPLTPSPPSSCRSVLEREPAAEHVDPADPLPDHRILRVPYVLGLPPYATPDRRGCSPAARTGSRPAAPRRRGWRCEGEVSRLKALAVFAFWAAITRLPGHWSPRLSPLNTTWSTTPSRSTIAAHMSKPRPPLASSWISRSLARSACDWGESLRGFWLARERWGRSARRCSRPGRGHSRRESRWGKSAYGTPWVFGAIEGRTNGRVGTHGGGRGR